MKKILLITICVAAMALSRWGGTARAENNNITKKQSLPDGVSIAVHYSPGGLRPYHEDVEGYTNMILNYALEAYNEIVYKQGFDSPGFTFANPDKDYCYDKDRTIDIYIAGGSIGEKGVLPFSAADFLEAPCYDIIRGEGRDYDAIILFPADYKGYLKTRGDSDFSRRHMRDRLRASLYHEIFHLITYSYNKNIERWYNKDGNSSRYEGGDWYVEGLARYFETISGSYDNFFSEGFVREDGGTLRIFQAGANYLMRHPRSSLKSARYDYSLFWAYIHKRYGMPKIEEISRRLRFISEGNINTELPRIVSLTLNEKFDDIISGFAVAMYFRYFNPEIRRGLNELKVMSLDDFSRKTNKNIPSWASNFITLNLADNSTPDYIAVKKANDNGKLKMNIFFRLKNGKIASLNKVTLDNSDILCRMNLEEMKRNGVKELILIITNLDTKNNMAYRILQS